MSGRIRTMHCQRQILWYSLLSPLCLMQGLLCSGLQPAFRHSGIARNLFIPQHCEQASSKQRLSLSRVTCSSRSFENSLRPQALTITNDQQSAFSKNGFVEVPNVLTKDTVDAIKDRYPELFAGRFDTGIYPDEWHWREGISLPNAMREICNGWKSDSTLQQMVLHEAWGRLACQLMGWPGARIAQDSVLWKPPGGSSVAWHQDSPYISDQFRPAEENSVTIWIALDDADDLVGTMQYARGSHLWARAARDAVSSSFHLDPDQDDPNAERLRSQAAMRAAARAAGVPDEEVEVVLVEAAAGSAILHHQDVWHGSGPNRSSERHRRALAIHLLRADVEFVEQPGYIYGRYKLGDDRTLHPSFFPEVFSA